MRVRRGEGSSCALSLSCLVGNEFCASPNRTAANPPWCGSSAGYVKGAELRETCPLDHVNTLVFEPCAAPRIELKLSGYVAAQHASTPFMRIFDVYVG